MVSLHDEETQRNGTVAVIYDVGNRPSVDLYALLCGILDMEKAMLGRVEGGHYCYDSVLTRPVISLSMMFSRETVLARLRPHYGTCPHVTTR